MGKNIVTDISISRFKYTVETSFKIQPIDSMKKNQELEIILYL